MCPDVAGNASPAERLSGYLECQASQLDLAAFQGGVWHGLPGALVTALLTIYVAVAGYRLLLGYRYDLATIVLLGGRLGIVLVLTTGLSAYSTLVYDVFTQGPGELAAMVAAPLNIAPGDLTTTAHVAQADLDALSPNPVTPAAPTNSETAVPAPATPAAGLGNAVFLLSCLGFGLAARLALALLLATGPLFIAAALFDVSLGLTIGWLRALATLFLAQAGYMVCASLELSFLAQDIARATPPPPSMSAEPMLLGCVFTAIGLGITLCAVMVGGGLTGLVRTQLGRQRQPGAAPAPVQPSPSPWGHGRAAEVSGVSRAVQIGNAVSDLTRREAERMGYLPPPGWQPSPEAGRASTPYPVQGAALRRAGSQRASPSAAKRDSLS